MGDQKFSDAAGMLCGELSHVLMNVPESFQAKTTEIRLRAGRPLCLMQGTHTLFVDKTGGVCATAGSQSFVVSSQQVQASFLSLCGWAVHTHQKELSQGYIAVSGGHRAGIAGSAVVENGVVKAVRDIKGLNLRIAREIFGAADELINRCFAAGGVRGALLAGAPASGKTTVLRDLARQMAGGARGRYYKVCVVDESGELGACSNAGMSHDLGVCTDLLSGYPKAAGLEIAVRYLSPELIICDEIATEREIAAIEAAANCGAAVVTSVHAAGYDELRRKKQLGGLLQTGAFEYAAILWGAENPSRIREVRRVQDI